MSDNEHDNGQEAPKRKGPDDCLTPATTIAVVMLVIVISVGRWALGLWA